MAQMWSAAAFLMIIALLVHSAQAQGVNPKKALFVFGDSLVDPGNNNYIATIAKANFAPNGVDFPGGVPTGRFCNGRTVADVITQKLSLPFLPAYLDPNTRGPAILGGINYASAAGGILDGTGANYIGRLSMNTQIQYFQNTQQQFIQQLGPVAAKQVFANSLYFFVIGSNDYINNYLQPSSQTARQYSPKQYEAVLVNEFSRQLTALYNLGGRKFAIFNVGPLGCIPSQLANQRSPDGRCITFINDYVQGFNGALRQQLTVLTARFPGSTFVYGDAYSLVFDRVTNPGRYGLINVNSGCCGIGAFNGQLPCITGVSPCAARNQYLFWDPFHPTDAVNVQLGNAFYTGGSPVISPMNIQQLAALP
ncbi:hypothetical protein R1sor_002584 [Riccia sorocarpa]|uniref:GDSL esterase/lipase n=1 Tax=Riccia sorocarpa TaxID=122646 RepID=A0ABD3H2B6_9MARC